MKITLETVIDALRGCDEKQRGDFLYWVNKGQYSWASHELEEIVTEHIVKRERFDKIRRGRKNLGGEEADLDNPSIDAIASDRMKGY